MKTSQIWVSILNSVCFVEFRLVKRSISEESFLETCISYRFLAHSKSRQSSFSKKNPSVFYETLEKEKLTFLTQLNPWKKDKLCKKFMSFQSLYVFINFAILVDQVSSECKSAKIPKAKVPEIARSVIYASSKWAPFLQKHILYQPRLHFYKLIIWDVECKFAADTWTFYWNIKNYLSLNNPLQPFSAFQLRNDIFVVDFTAQLKPRWFKFL